MASANLWPRPNDRSGGGGSSTTTLVEFRAGKCDVAGTRVTPENGKGLFQVIRDSEDVKHVRWKNRSNDVVEEDYYIFPEDADMKKVTQSSGRVMLLRWRDRSRNLFFWMQEPTADRDDELLNRVNEAINGSAAMVDTSAEDLPAPGVVVPSTTPAMSSREGGAQTSTNQITTEQLQSIFQSMAPQMAAADSPSVAELLSPEVVLPILHDPVIQESLQSLVQHLPDGDSSADAISELLRTPEFRQQVQVLSQALQSGQAGELLRSFGLHADNAETSSGMSALLQGLLRYHAETRDDEPQEEDQMDES